MSLIKQTLLILTLSTTLLAASEPVDLAAAPAAVSAVNSTVATNVSLQLPQQAEWYRTVVLFLGIAAVATTFVHGISNKRKSS
jgi:hypothetical protein